MRISSLGVKIGPQLPVFCLGHARSNGGVRFDTGSSILAISAHAQ